MESVSRYSFITPDKMQADRSVMCAFTALIFFSRFSCNTVSNFVPSLVRAHASKQHHSVGMLTQRQRVVDQHLGAFAICMMTV